MLSEASPEGFKDMGRLVPMPRSQQQAWSVPVIADGRLFLRDQDYLFCYDLRP